MRLVSHPKPHPLKKVCVLGGRGEGGGKKKKKGEKGYRTYSHYNFFLHQWKLSQ